MLVSYFRKSREKNNIFAHNVVPSQAGPLEARQARMSLNIQFKLSFFSKMDNLKVDIQV